MLTTPTEWLAGNGVALVLLVLVLGGWARSQTAVRLPVVWGAVFLTLALAILLVLFRPAQVPTGWITVLMEGGSIRNVQQLYGQGAHFGSGFYALTESLSGHDVTTLPAVVHFNLCVALVNAIIFYFIASYVLQSWWVSLVFALVYAGNPNTWHAAFSETPATLWATHFWLGCIAATVIDDDQHTTLWLRRMALLWLALLVWLAAQLRSELLVLGAPALAVAAAKTFGWESAARRATQAGVQLLHSIVAGRLSTFLIVGALLVLCEFLPWQGNELAWSVAGFRPLNLSFLSMPGALGVFLPFGVIVLFVLGMVHMARRWLRFLLLPVTLLILFKIYWSASHGVSFERFRYLTFLTPVALFAALFGFRELVDWAQRWAWPSWWKRPVVLLLVMSCVSWQLPGPKEIFRRRHQLPRLASTQFLLGWNQQTEVRYLLDLVGRYPDCIFVVKTTQAGWVADKQTGYQWTAFGKPVPRYRETPVAGGSLEQVAEQLAPGATCVLFYRSLDCDLVGSDRCHAETQGRVPLEEQVLENLPYSDITEYGAHHPEIHLGVYPVVPPSGGA